MYSLVEITSTGGTITSELNSPEVMSIKVLTVVHNAPRFPKPKPTLTREVPKLKKDKQKKTLSVRESLRKNPNTQAQRKENPSTQEKGKVVDLEAKEGIEDIDIDKVDHILKLPEYIPSCQGKVKVLKDLDEGQFLLNTPLLPENITFQGSRLVCIPHLKLEYWDLGDIEWFPQLAIDTFVKQFFYKEFGVTMLELVEWIRGVNKAGLLNLLWVPHYHHTPISVIVIN